MNAFALEAEGISKFFPGVKALDNVSLRVRPGTVHALMGENGAGKSTLMKCLIGIYRPDKGAIRVKGEPVQFQDTMDALRSGISMIHQELNLVPHMTVAENIWLGREPMKYGFVDHRQLARQTQDLLDKLNIRLSADRLVGELSIASQQMVEIAKAVSYNSKVLVLDEPTSSLTEKEVAHLFRIIDTLKERGVGIVYISHKMEEILKIADDVTVMRDGQWVATERAENLTTDKIISLMVGRDLTHRFPPKTNKPAETILEVKGLTALNQPSIQDVTFNLHKGEILGVAGLVGSKRTEIVETLFGLRPIKSGDILLHGKKIRNRDSRAATENGFALVTEERRQTGIFSMLDINFNSTIANMGHYVKFGILSDKQRGKDTKWVIDSMRVKTPNQKTQIGTLSGGNQQKVILGRWLLTGPEVLMLDEPTRGIDVGAKYEIYQLMIDLANKDKGIIMISSEMPELLGVTDRILVMSNGRVAGIVNTAETTQEEIMALSAKYL